ncbi:MAG: hypothetical protein F6K31_35480, partial [Symploca sp. SIO2G7]|nr:hypothetical protein [Symploca sp. SIO2G7]
MTSFTKVKWDRLSFASTLYLCPIVDTLLEHAPSQMHDELRLGLQEALVNAAPHQLSQITINDVTVTEGDDGQ